jgi:2-dehydropantoate 2-reductase
LNTPVVVVGGGSLGCLLAAVLSRATTTTLITRGTTADVLRRRGAVELQGLLSGRYPVAVHEDFDPAPGAHVVVAVKAYDLDPTLALLAARLDAADEVVLLQNGLGIGAFATRILSRPVTRGITFIAAERLQPGVVRFNAAGKTYFPATSAMAALWHRAGLPAEPVQNIDVYEWRKLAINAVINPLSALLGVENGALDALADTAHGLVEELVQVACHEGIVLDADETLEKVLASIRQTGRNHSSMLQDVRAGRRTEIDWINGAIVARGMAHGIATPRHRLLADLVRFAAREPRAAVQEAS